MLARRLETDGSTVRQRPGFGLLKAGESCFASRLAVPDRQPQEHREDRGEYDRFFVGTGIERAEGFDQTEAQGRGCGHL